MTEPTLAQKHVSVLVETPRGLTASTTVQTGMEFDSLLDRLWEVAAARDLEGYHKKKKNNNDDAVFPVKRSLDTQQQQQQQQQQQRRMVRRRLNSYAVHEGRVLGQDNYHKLLFKDSSSSSSSNTCLVNDKKKVVSLRLRLLGGMVDRQNRVGSKFGGGGVSSSQNAERERKERLKRLALESIDLAKDPYLMRNHLGTYECKLCLTIHPNEANYLSHTQGKKHQQGLARRAFLEKQKQERDAAQQQQQLHSIHSQQQQKQQSVQHKVRIGRPAYQVMKSRDYQDNQRCLTFELSMPEISVGIQPRHRFMSAFEQRVDTPPDRRYQYLLIAADPYETVAFKIPNEPIDKGEGRFVTHWDPQDKKFTLTLSFLNPPLPGTT